MIIICIKASHQFGLGHFFRSVNIAKFLDRHDKDFRIIVFGKIDFLIERYFTDVQKIEIQSEEVLNSHLWEAKYIEKYRPTIWINDRLETGSEHVKYLQKNNIRVITFDDFGSGAGISDLHIAALASITNEIIISKNMVAGLEYLFLNPLVHKYRKKRFFFKKLIVSLGGTDTYSVTQEILKNLDLDDYQVTVVFGPGVKFDDLKKLKSPNITYKTKVQCLVTEMASHDVAITNGGITAFEAIGLGIPTFIIANEKWEIAYGKFLENLKCAVFLGYFKQVDYDRFKHTVCDEVMSESCSNLGKLMSSRLKMELFSGNEGS